MGERINKALARAGVASRRGVEKLINEGRITVDGEPAVLGLKVDAQSTICVDGKPVQLVEASTTTRHVIAYHKPEGELCTADDPAGRRTVFDGIGSYSHGRLINVGRLDINTAGLLLLTTDGELAHRLMHPSHEIERVYRCRVRGKIEARDREALLRGVDVDGKKAAFSSLKAESQRSSGVNAWYTVSLKEGRNREVRKLFEAVGGTVNRLIRIQYGPIELTRDLLPGQWQELDDESVRKLANAVSLDHA